MTEPHLRGEITDRSLATAAGRVAPGQDLLREVVRQAVAAAAFTCTRPGADPPAARELRAFLREPGGAAVSSPGPPGP